MGVRGRGFVYMLRIFELIYARAGYLNICVYICAQVSLYTCVYTCIMRVRTCVLAHSARSGNLISLCVCVYVCVYGRVSMYVDVSGELFGNLISS